MDKLKIKEQFIKELREFVSSIKPKIETDNFEWTIKGFIDVYKNIYTISNDTKIISKILEIHILQFLLEFAKNSGYEIVLANYQNYYPDLSFISLSDNNIKFAVDLKTTYRLDDDKCNGFTLGSHGEYFSNRTSTKNIQFPYNEYLSHICLGIIYSRNEEYDNLTIHNINQLKAITSVINNLEFFVNEKWKIASDKSGSGNTANIGSIKNILDIINGNGTFSKLGENVFDEYWINYKKIKIINENGIETTINNVKEFLNYRGIE
jgi:hypothetical protein